MIHEKEYIRFAREAENGLPQTMGSNPYIEDEQQPLRLAIEWEIDVCKDTLRCLYRTRSWRGEEWHNTILILRYWLNRWQYILHRKEIYNA